MRQAGQREEDHDAGDGEQDQRREHARDVEPVARLGDAVGEAGPGAGGAGRDLGHHRADQRESAGDPNPAEDVGEGRRQLETKQHLAARGAVEPIQIGEVVVDRVEAERGVGEHREEGDDPRAGEHRGLLRQPDEQQRRDRDHRRHLQDHRIGIERIFDQPRDVEQHRKPDAAGDREEEPLECRDQGGEQRVGQEAPIRYERPGDQAGAGQHIGRDRVEQHHLVPEPDAERQRQERQHGLQPALARRCAVGDAHAAAAMARVSACEAIRQ